VIRIRIGFPAPLLREIWAVAIRSVLINREEKRGTVMTEKSTRDHLIEVGQDLMHRHGYNATGLSDILKAADVPKGSFYHHFGSKEEFAAAALDTYIAGEAKHSAAVLKDSRITPLRRLRQYFMDLKRIYGQTGTIPGCMMGRFSLEIAEENPQLRKKISTAFQHWQHTISMVIQQAITEKELPPATDAESLAGFLLNSWEGALLRSQAEKNDAPLEIFLRYALDALARKPNQKTHRKRH
jgi:TetR/AcrR family transcriptional repressor of nem operon